MGSSHSKVQGAGVERSENSNQQMLSLTGGQIIKATRFQARSPDKMGPSNPKVRATRTQNSEKSDQETTPHQDLAIIMSKLFASLPAFPITFTGSTQARLITPAVTSMPEPHFRFLDLPPEIRVMIYEEVLVVGKVFYTPTEHDIWNGKRCRDYKLYRKPELQLLRVCKQTHSEAEPTYLSKNLFVLPFDFHRYQPVVELQERQPCSVRAVAQERYLFSNAGRRYIRNISFAYDKKVAERTTLSFPDFDFWKREELVHGRSPFDQLSDGDVIDQIHELNNNAILDEWTGITESVLERISLALHYIEVDYTNAFCPIGCCRPIVFGSLDWLDQEPETVEVVGLRDAEERTEFIRVARTYMDIPYSELKKTVRFRKDGEGTPWDKWRKEGKVPDEKERYRKYESRCVVMPANPPSTSNTASAT